MRMHSAPRWRWAALALLLLSACPSGLLGYVDYPYTATFQTIRPVMLPIWNENPGEGHWGLRTASSLENVWSIQRSRFIIDGERLQIEPSVRYALTDRVQLGFSVPLISDGGGITDSTIEAFHRSLGVTQGLRDHFPENKMNVSYEPYGPYYPYGGSNPLVTWLRSYDYRAYPRVPYDPPVPLRTTYGRPDPTPPDWLVALSNGDLAGYAMARQRGNPTLPADAFHIPYEIIPVAGTDQAGAGNPRLFLQAALFRDLWIFDEVAGGIQVKFPMGGPAFIGTPGTDINVFSVFRTSYREFGFAAGFGWTRYSVVEAYSIRLPRGQSTVRLSAEYTPQSGDGTWLSEYVYFSKPTAGMGELSKPGHLVSFGYRHSLGGLILSYLFAENFLNFGVTPDAGIMFSAEVIL